MDGLTGLLLIPVFEFGQDRLVDVVGPVVDLEDLAPVGAAGAQHQGGQEEGG